MISRKITRRAFHRMMLASGAGLMVSSAVWAGDSDSPFVHPGLLHTASDLERMQRAVRTGRQPIAAGFEKLRAHPLSSADYSPHGFAEEIGRNPSVHFGEFDSDAGAAYQCALMAAVTGDNRYAQVARRIVLGWSASLQRVSGADAVLMAALGPFKLINAAEILRHIGELDAPGAAGCAAMLKRAILPTIIDFAPFANGNWDTAAVKTMMAIAVFCDDPALFERALQYYLHGDGDGRLNHYIYDNGQCQESGRDQQHTQLGLAHMGDACQIAWNQGWDLFSAMQDRLLRGFEYTASYNLGEKVEFRPDVDRTGQYRHSVISPPGALRPVYEQILAHYHVRRGLAAAAVQRAVEKIRPEGAAHGADHTGFGTLLYACGADDPVGPSREVPPAALHVRNFEEGIELDWLQTRRGEASLLECDSVAERVDERLGSWLDRNPTPGKLHTYHFSRPSGAKFKAASASMVAGLPRGWTSAGLGNPGVAGSVQFDGKVVTLCAGGRGLMQPADEGHFIAVPAEASRMVVRFVPQTASQFAAFGLACRSSLAADASAVALLVLPGSGVGRRRGWHVRLMARNATGTATILSDTALAAPVVSYGRLVGGLWLRVQAQGPMLDAAFSPDGTSWTMAGRLPRPAEGRLGLIAASGIPEVGTAVHFDIVTL